MLDYISLGIRCLHDGAEETLVGRWCVPARVIDPARRDAVATLSFEDSVCDVRNRFLRRGKA